MEKIDAAPQDTLSDALKLLVQAHFTEYQAIVARISRFVSLQFVVWPVWVAFLILVATRYETKKLSPILFAWGSVLATQCAVQIYNFALYEVYNHVRYIENALRPKVATLLGTDSFWGYERYLNKTGKANHPLIGDIAPTVGSLAMIGLATLWRWHSWSKWDFLSLAIIAIVFNVIRLSAFRIVKVRAEFSNTV